jgi:hypothetical protein
MSDMKNKKSEEHDTFQIAHEEAEAAIGGMLF